MPAPQNAPSGSARGLLVWSLTKVMDVSVRQLSNAYLPSWCKDITVIKNLVTMQAPGIGISNAGLTLPESISGCYADHAVENFFHEYVRCVGMVPRSSLKEGKYSQMVKRRTKTTQPQKTTANHSPKAESLTVDGPEFSNEEHGSEGLCSSKVAIQSLP